MVPLLPLLISTKGHIIKAYGIVFLSLNTQEDPPSSCPHPSAPLRTPSAQLHRCPLYLLEQRADLGVAAVHGPLPERCYHALLEAFKLTLHPVIDFPVAARSPLLS